MRRILFVILGLGVGGAEQQLLKILPRMKGEAMVVSLTDDDDIGRRILAEGVDVRYLGLRRDLLNLPAVVVRFGSIVRAFRPDVAYGYLIHANLFIRVFARLFGVRRVVCSVRNRRIDKPFLSLVDRWTQRLVDLFVPNSPALVDFLVEQQRIPREKIVVVENAIDVAEYEGKVDVATVRRNLGIAADAFVVVCPAKLHWQKDHETLLRAVAEVPDVILLLAGDGTLRSCLEALAGELGLRDRVHFLGWRADTVALLKAANVFVLASRFEGMSNALMEAMAARTPAIVSRIPENTVLIDGEESGIVFEVGDASALAQALRNLRDAGLRARLTDAAYRRILRNDVPSLVERVREVATGSVSR